MKELQQIFGLIFNRFPAETVVQFAESFRKKEIEKGAQFLSEGETCRHLAFIKKGAMMCYYLKNGKRYIDEFSLDGEFITDYTSFLNQTPSDKTIECIENSTVYIISHEMITSLYSRESFSFERLGRTMSEQLYFQWHEKSKSLLMDDATERYKKLIHNRPSLPQRVQQYLIAEYLGITPESLSRIRKELSK